MAGIEYTTEIDFSGVDVLTFDCYGTLIDWETGIAEGIGAMLAVRGVTPPRESVLETYAVAESHAEAGDHLPYREVLRRSARFVCARFGVRPRQAEVQAFAASVADWPAFPDSAAALARLRSRFRLGVITNCDDDLFAGSSAQLGDPFTWVLTAQQAHSYKPALHNFELALERIGVPREQIVHVAQSLYHDHLPAQRLGLRTVWINRRHGQVGSGATPPVTAVPTLAFHDMASFATAALGRPG
jgi:2-haloacid dehalogenase